MKYLFSDLDGTLMLDENMHSTGIDIPKHNMNAIKLFEEKNNIFAIATGRPYIATKHINEHNKLSDFSVCENGMIVSVDNEFIFEDSLDSKELEFIFNYCNNNDIEYLGFYKDENVCFFNDRCVLESTNIRINKYGGTYKILPTDQVDLNKVIHLTLLFSNQEKKQEIMDGIQPKLTNSRLVHTMNDAADFIKNETSKLNAIKKIMELKDIDFNDVGYVGDGLNDLECLNYFKHSYVMKNATDVLLNELDNNDATFVTSVSEAINIFLEVNNEH